MSIPQQQFSKRFDYLIKSSHPSFDSRMLRVLGRKIDRWANKGRKEEADMIEALAYKSFKLSKIGD